MKCPHCGNQHEDHQHKQCAYCLVANSTHYWHIQSGPTSTVDQAKEAAQEARSEAKDMSDGGWIE